MKYPMTLRDNPPPVLTFLFCVLFLFFVFAFLLACVVVCLFVCLFVCVEYMAYSTLYYVLCVQLLKLKCAVQTPCTTAQQRHILDTLQLGVSLHSLFDDIVKLLATLGLHFHTLLRHLCTLGRPFGVPWPSLGSFIASFGTPGAPRSKSLKKKPFWIRIPTPF